MDDNGMAKGLCIGLLAGAIFGVAVGILYAPKPGAETREMLREKALEAKDKTMEVIEKADGMLGKFKNRTQKILGGKDLT
jgi:gas vesicle protein